MARPTKRNLERQFSALLADPAPAETRTYVDKCKAWLKTRKDGRGTTADAIHAAFYTSVRFNQALGARNHEDPSIRRLAAKAVTAARHESFPEIQNRLKTLAARLSSVGRRAAEKRRRAAERTIDLDDRFVLRELRTATSLQRVGRALGNCVAKASFAREYLRDADTEMWALVDKRDQRPTYLMRVDHSTNEIDELEGAEGMTPRLEYSLAINILRALAVTADEEQAFCAVGAFTAFLDGRPLVDPIDTDGCSHRVWVLRGGTEIIVATDALSGQCTGWSRFRRHSSDTLNHPRRRQQRGFVAGPWNHLSEAELLAYAVDHPAFAESLRFDVPGRTTRKAHAA